MNESTHPYLITNNHVYVYMLQAFGYRKGSLIGATVQQLFNTSLEGLLLRQRTSSFAPFGRLSVSDGMTLGQNNTGNVLEEPAGQDPSGAVEGQIPRIHMPSTTT